MSGGNEVPALSQPWIQGWIEHKRRFFKHPEGENLPDPTAILEPGETSARGHRGPDDSTNSSQGCEQV